METDLIHATGVPGQPVLPRNCPQSLARAQGLGNPENLILQLGFFGSKRSFGRKHRNEELEGPSIFSNLGIMMSYYLSSDTEFDETSVLQTSHLGGILPDEL